MEKLVNGCGDIPFRAALFDLDGTLLDSMGVWRRVDEAFFAARGMAVPENYGRELQGRSFRESAEYTIERFGLSDTCEELMAEWTRMTADEYAHRVGLKPGARDYLRMLKRAGVKLAAATANRPELFVPALERGGVLELFDALCTAADVGDRGKGDGALFLYAAERLGTSPAECAVFEDVYEGIAGAKKAGMRAYCIRDGMSAHHFDRIAALADGMADDFHDMRRWHPFPDNARRCVIITARCDGDPQRAYAPRDGDCVLCADGGWRIARDMGLRPEAVIGDFDSSDAPGEGRVVRVPVEKDDTDTMLCLKHGLARGFDDFLIVGGFGGRTDHTLANFQALKYAADRGAHAEMCDGKNWAAVVRDGALRVCARPGKLSVFAMDAECRGVCLRGTKYPLDDGVLTNAFPLGVSNEFAEDAAEIAVRDGALLILACGE